MTDPVEPATLSYSVIPCRQDHLPHAVWDFVLLSLRLDGGRLWAVCGHEMHPDNRLPAGARLCPACNAKLPAFAIARPAPGQPMLKELARIISTDIRRHPHRSNDPGDSERQPFVR